MLYGTIIVVLARHRTVEVLSSDQVELVAAWLSRHPWIEVITRDRDLAYMAAANHICAKRLMPFLPELVPVLEQHGHLTLEEGVRNQLLQISAATADRILKSYRQHDKPHGVSTTRRGTLLKKRISIRTFADWVDTRPGFIEADLVAHCGYYNEGS